MAEKQEVLQYLEDHKLELAQLLGDLIRIPSVNRKLDPTSSEYNVQQFVRAKMESLGLEITERTYDPEGLRPNVMATLKGTGGGKDFMMHAHADTVPTHAYENWEHDPFGGEFDGTWIHGRGAGDDKWGVAAGIYVLQALKACGVTLSGDVHVLASSGEESGEGETVGAGPFVRDMEKRPDFVAVCEGTVMEICPETNCSLNFELHIKGKATHANLRNAAVFPQPHTVWSGRKEAVDALQKALPIIDALYRLERDLSIDYDRGGLLASGGREKLDKQGVGAITINPTTINGGAHGTVMGEVNLAYCVTYPPTYTAEELFAIIEETVMSTANADRWLRDNPPVVKHTFTMPGFRTPIDHPAIPVMEKAFEEALGRPAGVSGWKPQCDGTWISPYAPCVVFGPQPPGTHSANERITLNEVLECAKVFASMAMDYCK